MSGIVQSSKVGVLIAGLAALLAAPSVGSAQSTDYPSQRISFIVGFAVGGFADTIGRWVAIRLGERTGQTVVVQNMEGGGGVRAARRVAMSLPDSYTILVTTTSLTRGGASSSRCSAARQLGRLRRGRSSPKFGESVVFTHHQRRTSWASPLSRLSD